MKKIYFLVSLIFVSLVLNHFLYADNIIDLVSNKPFDSSFLIWPSFRIFIEPFYAFAYYIMTMERSGYVPALISWICWSIIAVVIISKYYKISTGRMVCYSFAAMFFVVSVICNIIITPLPGPCLSAPEEYKVADIHSHTISSKDNLSLSSSNIKFHNKHGYTDFFITEHDNTNGYNTIPFMEKTDNIFPGIQIRTKEGISILLLSQYPFNYYDFKGMTIPEMVEKAHSKDMLAVVPHWWKWNKPPLETLVEAGVDGFEIYNCGYRYITPEKRETIKSVCRQNGLPVFGTTDWHGLGYMSNVWTLVKKDGSKTFFELLKDKPETKVIVHDTKGSQSLIRYVFEPFFVLYYYITSTKIEYILSFYMIVTILILLVFHFKAHKVVKFVSLFFALFYTLSLVYFVNLLNFDFTYNVIIPETIVPTALSLIVIWLIIWGFCECRKDI